MGFLPKRLTKQNLNQVSVFIEDADNEYFHVTDLSETLAQGRYAFKIFGSDLLRTDVELKLELLDAAGNTIYLAPVDFVGEEIPPYVPYRYVTIEVYPPPINTPGIATLTILGEVNPNVVDVPIEFQNAYNVRYTKTVNVDVSTIVNEEPIKFYKNPTAIYNESVIARILPTPVSQSIIHTTVDGISRSDLTDMKTTKTSGSQEKDDEPFIISEPFSDLKSFHGEYQYVTGLHGSIPALIQRRGVSRAFASEEQPKFKLISEDAVFKADMQGGNIEIPERSVTLNSTDIDGKPIVETVTVSKFETKILNVINEKTIVPVDIPLLPTFTSEDDPESKSYSIVDFSDTPLTASFNVTPTTVEASNVYYDSFLDLTIKDMRTFSGDIYRIKVHGRSEFAQSDFVVMADTIVESPELLVDTTSPSGFLRTGYFIDQSHVNTYWSTSSFDDSTVAGNVNIYHTGSQYIDSILISGSNAGLNQSVVVQTKPANNFTVRKNVTYTLSAKIKGRTTPKVIDSNNNVSNKGKLYFHLSGSNLNASTLVTSHTLFGSEFRDHNSGQPVVLELNEDVDGIQDLQTVTHTFTPSFNLDRIDNSDTILQLRAESGEWWISDLSLRPAMDTGFSPDQFSIRVPLPRTQRPDRFDFLIEYFDINSNVAETITTIQSVEISGSALVIDGGDNLLSGSLFMGQVVDTGIEAAGTNSAFIRSVGYVGFQSASLSGEGGFMIWSGSVLPNAPDDYKGAGIEIHDGVTGVDESYLKFRTNPSIFDVKTSTFFLGKTHSPANFISGSNGNLQISSSNFELTADGDVTMSGEISATGGTIGGFNISSTKISTTGVELGNSTEDLFISSSAFKVDHDGNITASNIDLGGTISATSGDVGGWTINAGSLTAGSGGSAVTMSSADKIIAMGSGSTFNKSDLGGGFRVGIDTDGVFKFAVGNSDSYIHADATGVSIKSDSFDVTASVAEIDVDVFTLRSNNLFISSSGGGFISAGNPRPTGITGTNKGFYVNGQSGIVLIGNAAGGHIKFDGTNTSISSSAFYLGGPSQYVSGSNGNVEISSSNFHLDNTGNVTMQGTITATAGNIGGFSVTDDALSSTNFLISGSSTGNQYFISSSNFNVKASGAVTASALQLSGGTAGGLTVSEGEISVGSILKFKDSGQITGSNVLFTGGTIGGFHISSTDFWGGNPTLGNSATKIVFGDIGDGETPKIALGASANSISLAGGTGLYVDGDGDFKIGSTNKYLKYTVSTDKLEIKTGTFELDTTNLDITATGDITGSSVLFTGGQIGGWTINSTNLASSGDAGIRLNANGDNAEISVNSHTFGNEGIQFGYNSGSPRFYAGNGGTNFLRYDTSNGVNIQTTRANISGSEITLETPKFYFGNSSNYISGSNGNISIYNTGTTTLSGSQVTIETPRFYFGQGNTQFISGSEGNLQISSSGFHLTPQGNVSASSILLGDKGAGDYLEFNSGVLTVQGEVFANSINTPAAAPTASSSITSDGFAKFVSASIGGWNVTNEYIYKPISGNAAHQDFSRVYMSSVQDDVKNIGEGFTLYRKDEDVAASETKIVRLGGLSNTTNLHHTEGEYGLQIIRKQPDGSGYENIVYIGGTTQQISGWNLSKTGLTDSTGAVQFSSTQASMSLGTSQEVVIRGNSNSPFISLQPSVALPDKNYAESGIFLGVQSGATPKFSVVGTGGHIKFDGTDVDITADTVHMSGSSITLETPKFYLGETSQYISGSNGNIEISSSKFHLQADGDVVMNQITASNANVSGKITATSGEIGGFTIGDDLSNSAGGSNALRLKGASGQITASKAQITGKVTATDGAIGGWNLSSQIISSVDSTGGIKFDSYNKQIGIRSGSAVETTILEFGRIGGTVGSPQFGLEGRDTSGNVIFKLGEAGNELAGWTISSDEITGGSMIIRSDGTIESEGFASDVRGSGFRLTAASGGFLEVENARIRGTLATAVFEKETVNAVGGQLYVANSTVLSGSLGGFVGASDTTMSVANVGGFVANEILSAKKVNATGFATEYMLVQSASRNNPLSNTDFSGKLYVTRGYGSGTTGDSGSLGETPAAAQTYTGSQVIVSTGKVGTGYIRLNANPNDPYTPYIDIVERTGSGIYAVDLKTRLGDLSGLSSARLHGTNPAGQFGLYSKNVYLEGAIVANTGSIGGIEMQAGKLYNGAGVHGNSNTGFYVDSGSKFSLGDKFVWDGSNLTVEGSITITAGPTAAQLAALNTTTGSLASDISDAETLSQNLATGAEASASAAETTAQNLATGAEASSSLVSTSVSASLNASSSILQGNINDAETLSQNLASGAEASSSAVQTNLDSGLALVSSSVSGAFTDTSASIVSTITTVSSSTAERIMTDISGSLLDISPSPDDSGLYLNYPYMGFYDSSNWKAFISASGGFLFKADENNLISFGQSTTGGDGASTKSFVLKSDNVYLSGSKVNILGERFFLGGNSQFVSGSNGNIEISSSKFHVKPDGDIVVGKVDATEGTIGGFDIGENLISSSDGGLILHADGGITGSKFKLTGGVITDDVTIEGDLSANSISTPTGGSPKSTITSEGYAKFVSASIGGFHVSTDTIKDTDEDLVLKSNGQITASNAKITGNIVISAGPVATQLQDLNTTTGSLEESTTALGEATSSFEGSITALGEATSSLETSVTSLGEATSSLSNQITGAVDSGSAFALSAATSGSLYASNATLSASLYASGAFASASIHSSSLASTITTVSSSTAERIMTDVSGALLDVPANPGVAGTYLNWPYMGFYDGSDWKAFISASGGFLFKADDDNLISFGQSVTGGDGSSTKNFVLKSDNVYLSGSKVNILGERFFLGGLSQFVSGSNGNIEISSSKFHVQPDGDVVMNNVTASNALISGNITISSGPAKDAIDSLNVTTSSLAGQITGSASDTIASASLYASGAFASASIHSSSLASTIGTTSASLASTIGTTSASLASTITTVSSSTAERIMTDAKGLILDVPAAPSGEGLFLNYPYLGFYNSSDWTAFISASGGFLFKQDENNLISFGQNATGGDGEATSSFVLRANNVYMSGSKINMLSDKFYLGGNSAYVSGSDGNIEISSSNFHLDRDGNVDMSGKITSTEGSIGGFAITSTAISSSNDNLILKSNGQITASAVSMSGTVTATSGLIGGMSIESNSIESTADAGDGSTTTYTVTSTGGSGPYVIAGLGSKPTLTFLPGNTYKFDISDDSNDNNPLRFATAADAAGSTEYTTGVTVSGTPGDVGAYVQIAVTQATPTTLYYYDANPNANAGNSITVDKTSPLILDGNTGQITGSRVLFDGGKIGGTTLTSGSLYQGTGTHDNSNTPFYLDSNGNFSLGDKLSWDGTDLSIEGSITITGGALSNVISSSAQIADEISGSTTIPEGTLSGSAQIADQISGSSNEFSASAASSIAGTLVDSGSIAAAVQLTSDGMNILNSGGNAIAQYSADAIIGRTSGTNSNILIDSDGNIDIRKGTVVSASFGTTTTIGPTGGSHVLINSEQIAVKRGTTTFLSASADGLEMSGSIKATGGTIGGFDIGSTTLEAGSGANFVSLDSGNSKLRIGAKTSLTNSNDGVHIGSDGISLGTDTPFKVTAAGALTTTSATIGKWVVTDELIKTTNGSIQLDGDNEIIQIGSYLLSGGGAGQTDLLILEGQTQGPLAFRLRVGAAGSRVIEAPFRVSGSGHTYASAITIGNVVGTANPPGEKLEFKDGTLTVSASDFYMGSSAQFISGSEGNIEISSSNFHLDNSGNVKMSGEVTATTGTIGGWSLNSTSLNSGDIDIDSDDDVITVGTDADYDIQLGTNVNGPFFQMGSAADDGTGTGMFMQVKDPGGGAGDRVTFNILQDQSGAGAGGYADYIKMSPAGNTGMSIKAGDINVRTELSGSGTPAITGFQHATFSGTVTAEQITSTDDITATGTIQGEQITSTDDITATSGTGSFKHVAIIDTTHGAGSGPVLELRNTDTSVAINDSIGKINFTSFDAGGGSTPDIVGQIDVNVRSNTYGASDHPTQMIFRTGDNDSGDLVEQLRLSYDTDTTEVNALFNYNLKINEALGVGVTPNATDGRIDAANDVVAFSSSDIRFKENTTPIQDALFKIKQLQGIEFDWKPLTTEEKKTLHSNEGHDVGVIAQEVEKVLPEVVQTRESGYKAVKYEKIIPLLIEGIKEQQEQIEELKKEVEELKNG